MARDIINNPYYKNVRRESTSEALLLDHLDAEKDHLIEQGYSEQQRFIDIRPIAFHYCLKYALPNQFVSYIALTYYDRFLSRHIDIPVVIQGGGFEHNLELFVFVCVKIAYSEIFQQSYSLHYFRDTHKMADEKDVEKMELLIRKGLEGSVTTPPTAFEPLIIDPLISLLEMEDEQLPELVYYVHQILFAINHDIKFTKFRPSILTASAILVACYRLYPVMYPAIANKIFKSGYVQQIRKDPTVKKPILLAEVQECFDKLKDHVITDFVFSPDKCPTLYRGNVSREQGKKLLIDNPHIPYQYVPNPEHPLEFFLEDHENKIDEFRKERQNQEHKSTIAKQEEEEEEDDDEEDRSEITEEEKQLEHESETEKQVDTSESVKEEDDDEQEHSSEITKEEEEHEDTYEMTKELEEVFRTWAFPGVKETEFTTTEWDPESELESEGVEEERYNPLQRILIFLCNSACIKCFGYDIDRRRSC